MFFLKVQLSKLNDAEYNALMSILDVPYPKNILELTHTEGN